MSNVKQFIEEVYMDSAQIDPMLEELITSILSRSKTKFSYRIYDGNIVAIAVSTTDRDENSVYIDAIAAIPTKQGNGTKALNYLQELAKKHNISIRLSASPFNAYRSMSQTNLIKWYKKNGFKQVRSKGSKAYLIYKAA